MQDGYPGLYAFSTEGNTDGKWWEFIVDLSEFIGEVMTIFVKI